MGLFDNVKNLFGTDKTFFDKEATIKEYKAIVPPNQRKKVNNYEELYQEALKYVGKQNFKENTTDLEDYFHEVTYDEGTIGVLLGMIAYAVAREIDEHGTDIEHAIDKMLPKGYDVNNPFDLKIGYGHRIFGHDPVTFGLKNIPDDLLVSVNQNGVKKIMKIGEVVGKSGNISMFDVIWKYYGSGSKNVVSGIFNCLAHTVVHFAKDLFTPAGLPLPGLSLFNEYEKNITLNHEVSVIKYKDSLMQKLDKNKINMKASDFASFFLIESFLKFYCESKKLGDKEKGFKQDMKLISMGTCISLQMATIIVGTDLQKGKRGNQPNISGGKVNVLMSGAFVKIAIQDMTSIVEARKMINNSYDAIG